MLNLLTVIVLGAFGASVVGEDKNKTHVELMPKFATPCTTPNSDVGVCVEVQKCSVFMDAIASGNTECHDFIRSSRCGPSNEDPSQPKVCCGKYADYLDKLTPSTSMRPKKPKNPLPKVCGNQTMQVPTRIIGGTTASLGEFPWMARLRHRRKDGVLNYGCAGFLISNQFVLTAAHCIRSEMLEPLGALYVTSDKACGTS